MSNTTFVTVIPTRTVVAMVNLDSGERTEFETPMNDYTCTNALPKPKGSEMLTWAFHGPKEASEVVFCRVEFNDEARRYEHNPAAERLRNFGCDF